jgi:peptidoglycan/xylan/chitin deacetylase (PgdA/CDA1 family)
MFLASALARTAKDASPTLTPCVALSFDDGPDMTLTPRLLDILAREKVHATFFVVGKRLAYSPGLVRRAFVEGHEIGNHTFDHRRLTDLPDGEAVAEIEMTDEAVMAETGHRPDLIRPPWGLIDSRVEAALRTAGLWRRIALWNFDSLDWLDDETHMTMLLTSGAPPGSVVLMHDIHASTIEAVPGIIHNLKIRGFHFSTISGLEACGNGTAPSLAAAPPLAAPASAGSPVGRSLAHALDELKPLEEYLAHRFGS